MVTENKSIREMLIKKIYEAIGSKVMKDSYYNFLQILTIKELEAIVYHAEEEVFGSEI